MIWHPEDGPNNTYRTEIAMAAVHMVAIPPGQAGRSEEKAIDGFIAKS